jgi:flagellar basal body rod protein FlgG
MYHQVLDDRVKLHRDDFDIYLNRKLGQMQKFLDEIPRDEWHNVRVSDGKQVYMWDGHFQVLVDQFLKNRGIKLYYHSSQQL